MNNNQKKPISFIPLAITGIAFITYNVLLFIIFKFEDHGGAFWCSYAFMLAAFFLSVGCGFALKSRHNQPRDWFMGYPIVKHCTVYLIIEFVLSLLFMILDASDCNWLVAFAIQFLLLAVFSVLILSGFFVKQVVEQIDANIKAKTSRLKLLQVDVEMIAESSANMEIKMAYAKLAEEIRFSDPMSSDALYDLEQQIEYLVGQAKTYSAMNDVTNSLTLCNKINLMLAERNKKCKLMK